jgi:Glycosyltransferase family 87
MITAIHSSAERSAGTVGETTPWWRATWAQIACLILLLPLTLHYVLLAGEWMRLYANDFGKFYYATQHWWHGEPMYAPSLATHIASAGGGSHDYLDMNPPHFHLLIWPLIALPLQLASRWWISLNFAIAVVAGSIACRELDWHLRISDTLPMATAILLCGATSAIVFTGQYMGLLLLLMVLAWRAARHGCWTSCGAWLGVLIGLKPFLAVFVPYLMLRGKWRALLALCAAGGGSFLVGLLIFGWAAHLAWWHALAAVDWIWVGMNGSLDGILTRNMTPSLHHFTPLLQLSAWQVRACWATASAIIVWRTAVALDEHSIDRDFASLILCALLISPLGWVYYLWIAAPPCAAIWRRHRPAVLWAALLFLTTPLVLTSAWPAHSWAAASLGSAYGWGTLCLWRAVVTTRA